LADFGAVVKIRASHALMVFDESIDHSVLLVSPAASTLNIAVSLSR
jgi:hypothetical protein